MNLMFCCVLLFTEMSSLKVLNLGFNDITGAVLVHLKGNLFAYIEFNVDPLPL